MTRIYASLAYVCAFVTQTWRCTHFWIGATNMSRDIGPLPHVKDFLQHNPSQSLFLRAQSHPYFLNGKLNEPKVCKSQHTVLSPWEVLIYFNGKPMWPLNPVPVNTYYSSYEISVPIHTLENALFRSDKTLLHFNSIKRKKYKFLLTSNLTSALAFSFKVIS